MGESHRVCHQTWSLHQREVTGIVADRVIVTRILIVSREVVPVEALATETQEIGLVRATSPHSCLRETPPSMEPFHRVLSGQGRRPRRKRGTRRREMILTTLVSQPGYQTLSRAVRKSRRNETLPGQGVFQPLYRHILSGGTPGYTTIPRVRGPHRIVMDSPEPPPTSCHTTPLTLTTPTSTAGSPSPPGGSGSSPLNLSSSAVGSEMAHKQTSRS